MYSLFPTRTYNGTVFYPDIPAPEDFKNYLAGAIGFYVFISVMLAILACPLTYILYKKETQDDKQRLMLIALIISTTITPIAAFLNIIKFYNFGSNYQLCSWFSIGSPAYAFNYALTQFIFMVRAETVKFGGSKKYTKFLSTTKWQVLGFMPCMAIFSFFTGSGKVYFKEQICLEENTFWMVVIALIQNIGIVCVIMVKLNLVCTVISLVISTGCLIFTVHNQYVRDPHNKIDEAYTALFIYITSTVDAFLSIVMLFVVTSRLWLPNALGRLVFGAHFVRATKTRGGELSSSSRKISSKEKTKRCSDMNLNSGFDASLNQLLASKELEVDIPDNII
eukprot:Pgem_evm1s472